MQGECLRDCNIDIDIDIDIDADVDVTTRRLTALKRERDRRH